MHGEENRVKFVRFVMLLSPALIVWWTWIKGHVMMLPIFVNLAYKLIAYRVLHGSQWWIIIRIIICFPLHGHLKLVRQLKGHGPHCNLITTNSLYPPLGLRCDDPRPRPPYGAVSSARERINKYALENSKEGPCPSWTMKSSLAPLKYVIGCWIRHGTVLFYIKENNVL